MTPITVHDNGRELVLTPPSYWGDLFGGWLSVEWMEEGE